MAVLLLFERPFVIDTSALINIHHSGHLERLNRLAENTLLQWTPGIAEEVCRREDRLTAWLARYPGETELSASEYERYREVIKLYGRPFRHQGRTRKPISEPDAEGVAVATFRQWILVTDDGSMRIVCDLYGGTWIGSDELVSQL